MQTSPFPISSREAWHGNNLNSNNVFSISRLAKKSPLGLAPLEVVPFHVATLPAPRLVHHLGNGERGGEDVQVGHLGRENSFWQDCGDIIVKFLSFSLSRRFNSKMTLLLRAYHPEAPSFVPRINRPLKFSGLLLNNYWSL